MDAAKALPHVGHRIECVTYGRPGAPENVAVECVDCSEVIADADVPGCEHEWIEDSYPFRECGLCGLVAESPEPTYDQGDT